MPEDRVDHHLVANIDLAPTFAQWAGGRAPDFVDGRSLLPILNNPKAPWRSRLLFEHHLAEHDFRAIRTGAEHVYIEYPLTNETEYYDLDKDPYQLHGQAQRVPPQLEGQLEDLMRCSGASCCVADGNGSSRGCKPGLCPLFSGHRVLGQTLRACHRPRARIRMADKIRACQWGAFDVENYGDRLFPLIANEQLTARLPQLELVCHAPVGHAALPPGSPPLFSLIPGGGPLDRDRREYFARHFDAVLIGGGDLLRFDPSEPGYGAPGQDGPPHAYDAFLDFLWRECEVQPTMLWNAPGVPFPFAPSRRPEERGRALLEPRGSGRNGRGRLCFQCGPGFLRREEDLVAKSLARIAARRNLEVVLLPMGWCHGDLDALRLVQEASRGRFTLVADVESPLEVGAVIGACDYFVGSSLHVNLTALSFGVPHIVVNNPLRAAKLEGYVRLAGLEEFRITDWAALEETFDRLAATPRERWTTTADRLKARFSEHFDRLAELIARAAEERRETGNRHAKSRAEILLELYTPIAELHARLEDERAARRAVERELSDSKKFLRDRHLAHEARSKRSEDRNERLEAEVRTLRARNERLEERLRGVQSSVTRRLLGPYRRLRSVRVDDTAGSR